MPDPQFEAALIAAAHRAVELDAVQLVEWIPTDETFAVVPDSVLLEDLAHGITHPEERLVLEAGDGREAHVFRILEPENTENVAGR